MELAKIILQIDQEAPLTEEQRNNLIVMANQLERGLRKTALEYIDYQSNN